MSTLEVASSRIKNLFFLRRALAKHNNCFSPTENTSAMLETSVYNFYGIYTSYIIYLFYFTLQAWTFKGIP